MKVIIKCITMATVGVLLSFYIVISYKRPRISAENPWPSVDFSEWPWPSVDFFSFRGHHYSERGSKTVCII